MTVLLVDRDLDFLAELELLLSKTLPAVSLVAKSYSANLVVQDVSRLRPDIVFLDISDINLLDEHSYDHEPTFELILTASRRDHNSTEMSTRASGFIYKPLLESEVISTVRRCQSQRKSHDAHAANARIKRSICQELICIPTTEGTEFLHAEDIIRCEGLQKCTRIFSQDRASIVSSYNIGVFRNLLPSEGFIQTHKSHLINLKHIRRYNREGTIQMSDESIVPLSRRRKAGFFRLVQGSSPLSYYKSQCLFAS